MKEKIEVQLIELEILTKIDEICKKYKIEYFLDSGTVLGAVRHGGFIPWDDDIDIGMTRENYEKFLKIAPKELGREYFLHNLDTEKECPCLYSKVKKNNTIYMAWASRNLKINQGIYIDIFPYDISTGMTKKEIKKLYLLQRLFKYIALPDRDKLPENTIKWKLGAILYRIIHYTLFFIPKDYIRKIIERKLRKSENENGKFLLQGVCGKPIIIEKDDIFPLKYIKFENKEFPVPKNTDKYLKLLYGNYMELPPVEKRKGHGIYKIKY